MPPPPQGHPAASASPEFLGYDGPLLRRAAERIVDGAAGPEDLGELLIAVPGARELLSERLIYRFMRKILL